HTHTHTHAHTHTTHTHSPLWFDVGARADVVLGGAHKLVVEDPLWLVVQHRRGMKLHHLVVLHRQVVTRPLQVSHLRTPQSVNTRAHTHTHTHTPTHTTHTHTEAASHRFDVAVQEADRVDALDGVEHLPA